MTRTKGNRTNFVHNFISLYRNSYLEIFNVPRDVRWHRGDDKFYLLNIVIQEIKLSTKFTLSSIPSNGSCDFNC